MGLPPQTQMLQSRLMTVDCELETQAVTAVFFVFNCCTRRFLESCLWFIKSAIRVKVQNPAQMFSLLFSYNIWIIFEFVFDFVQLDVEPFERYIVLRKSFIKAKFG